MQNYLILLAAIVILVELYWRLRKYWVRWCFEQEKKSQEVAQTTRFQIQK